MSKRLILLGVISLTVACATPYQPALDVSPLVPGSGEQIIVDHAMLLFDSSGSISHRGQFPGARAGLESFVLSMPDGPYEAGAIDFGGYKRSNEPLASFSREKLKLYAQSLEYLSEGTPTYEVLAEAGEELTGRRKRAAVVLFSDGLVTDSVGRDVPDSWSTEAARGLIDRYRGDVCFHTVQVGNDPAGTAFLNGLARLTRCGSARNIDSLNSAQAFHAFQRQVFLGDAPPPPPAPAAPRIDSDGDGVLDDQDQCPNTPKGANVDSRGCWVLEDLNFATNSAEIDAASITRLREKVVPVLNENPGLHVSVDGHTDSSGSAVYNKQLSERRARAVRDFLIAQGVDAARLQARGLGEENPIVPNDSPANMRKNRRTELTVVR